MFLNMSSYIPKCHHMQFNGSMQIILSVSLDTKRVSVCEWAAFFVWVPCIVHGTCKYEF